MLTPDSRACATISYALVRAALLGGRCCGNQSFGGRCDLHYDDVEDAAGAAETGNLTSTTHQMRTEARKTKGLEARFALVYRRYRSISAHAAARRLNASAWAGRTCSCKPCVGPQGLAYATGALEPSRQSCCSVGEEPGQQLEHVRCGRRSREVEGEQHGVRKL